MTTLALEDIFQKEQYVKIIETLLKYREGLHLFELTYLLSNKENMKRVKYLEKKFKGLERKTIFNGENSRMRIRDHLFKLRSPPFSIVTLSNKLYSLVPNFPEEILYTLANWNILKNHYHMLMERTRHLSAMAEKISGMSRLAMIKRELKCKGMKDKQIEDVLRTSKEYWKDKGYEFSSLYRNKEFDDISPSVRKYVNSYYQPNIQIFGIDVNSLDEKELKKFKKIVNQMILGVRQLHDLYLNKIESMITDQEKQLINETHESKNYIKRLTSIYKEFESNDDINLENVKKMELKGIKESRLLQKRFHNVTVVLNSNQKKFNEYLLTSRLNNS